MRYNMLIVIFLNKCVSLINCIQNYFFLVSNTITEYVTS